MSRDPLHFSTRPIYMRLNLKGARAMESITRRGFSRTMLAGAGLGLLQHGTAAPPKRVSKMKFGFTSYQWGGDWDIPTMIANLTKAKAFATGLRTADNY